MAIKVIVNQESGMGRRKPLAGRILREFSGHCVEVESTSGPGHATEIARAAARKGARIVVAVGGDGTVNEVLNGITGTMASLGIIPAGTANDLARHLKIPRLLSHSCALIRSRSSRVLDTVEVNGNRFLTAGGIGLACDIARRANRLKKENSGNIFMKSLLGGKIYTAAAFLALAKREHAVCPIEIQTTGRPVISDPLWIMISNQPRVGRYFLISPEARNDDGYFDVCMTSNTRSKLRIFSTAIRALAGVHDKLPYVSSFRADEMTIRSSRPIPFFGDGEILCESSEFKVRLVPESVRVLAPAPALGSVHELRDDAGTLTRPALGARS